MQAARLAVRPTVAALPHNGGARRHQGRPDLTLLLGLDVGTSRIKAVLLDGSGRELRHAAVATPFQSGELLVADLRGAVRRLCRELGDDRGRVAAVGIAGMAESGAPLDPAGRPQAPIIAWHDPRGAEVVERLVRRLGPELERSIGQRLRTVSSVAKLGWLADHGVGPIGRWLGVPELVLDALTGEQVSEFSLAARTGAYHVGRCRYLPDVAGELGVSPEVFAGVEPAGTPMGRVSPDGAAWSGLPAGIPVTLAGHDHLAGVVGSGAGADDLVNSVGTAETVVARAASLPDIDAALCERAMVTLMPGGQTWAVLASAARSGIVLAAIAAALGSPAEELDRQAEVSARALDPGHALVDAALSGRLETLPEASPGEAWNGVLDALAARTWDAVDRLARVGGAPTDGRQLVVLGGGSRSWPWLRAKAAARPQVAVWRSSAPEAAARGAALYGGVAAGWWPTPAAAPPAPLEPVWR